MLPCAIMATFSPPQLLPGGSDPNQPPHTPTTSSSATVEMVAVGSPCVPHSMAIFPTSGTALDSSTSLLPQNLSDLMSPKSDEAGEELPHEHALLCLWDKCLHEFTSLSSLVTHLDQTHTMAMTQFVCLWENCSRQMKPFDARYKLVTHLRCHTGEKPYQCDVTSCLRSFSRLENLKLHTRTHTGEKPYQCDFISCAKRFNNTSDRAKHKKTHITRKPYACRYPGCGKSYTDPSSMRKHIKYTHRLKEEAERTGLPLMALPKRKRNSASSSSSSSGSSSTPHTPQQTPVIFQSPQTSSTGVHDLLHAGMTSPPAHRGGGGGVASTPSSQTQLVPMVKIAAASAGGKVGQGSQPVLVPAYQQPPVMMILANSSSPATNWVTVPTSTITTNSPSHPQLQSGSSSNVLNSVRPTPGQVKASGASVQRLEVGDMTSTSSATSIEELKLQIAQLQQQLYQSQLVAARTVQKPQLVAVSQAAATEQSLGERMDPAGAGGSKCGGRHVQGAMVMQSPSLHKIASPHAINGGGGNMEQHAPIMAGVRGVSFSPPGPRVPAQRAIHMPGNNGVAMTMGGAAMETAQTMPQYIPIPVVQTQDAQYLYMSQ